MFTVTSLLLDKPMQSTIKNENLEEQVIYDQNTGKPSPELIGAVVMDILAGLGLIIAGALVANGIIVLDTAGVEYAMIGLGAFQLAPFMMGSILASKKDNQLFPALQALGITYRTA